MNIKKLKSLTHILKIAKLCVRAGLSPGNIQQKISRGSELNEIEVLKLNNELRCIIEQIKE